MLQRDDPAPFVRALSGDSNSYALAGALREEILDGIRQLGFDPDDTALSNDEQDAIDLVGILFQSLVQANELMQRARTMYGKLVVPYRSEEHTSELQSLMRISYAVFCLKNKTTQHNHN